MHDHDHAYQDWAHAYFDLAPVVFLVLNEDLTVRRINKKGAAILELHSTDIVGKDWLEHFVARKDRAKQRDQFSSLLEVGGSEPLKFEAPVVTSSGHERNVRWTIQLITHDANTTILCAGEDITKRRDTEKALRETEAKAHAILNTTVDAVITIDERGLIDTPRRLRACAKR